MSSEGEFRRQFIMLIKILAAINGKNKTRAIFYTWVCPTVVEKQKLGFLSYPSQTPPTDQKHRYNNAA